MQPPLPVVVTAELRRSVTALLDRLDSRRGNVAKGWAPFAGACGVEQTRELSDPGQGNALVVFGTFDDLAHRLRNHNAEFGFVTPASNRVRSWQRSKSWYADPTMRLWRLGWSPVAVDRVTVATDEGLIEFAVGSARVTPEVSPLDDAD